MRLTRNLALIFLTAYAFMRPVSAQAPSEGDLRTQKQKQKLAVLDRLNGEWRGNATITMPGGGTFELIQTERVGPLLDGAVKVVEGTGYDAGGIKRFNALGIIAFNIQKDRYEMRSYAQGRLGDYVLELTDSGFAWEIPAGATTIRYVATVTDTSWNEVGQRITEGQPPITFIEMDLEKIGATDWPASDPVAPN